MGEREREGGREGMMARGRAGMSNRDNVKNITSDKL